MIDNNLGSSIIFCLVLCGCIFFSLFHMSTDEYNLLNELCIEIVISIFIYFSKKFYDLLNRSHFMNKFKYENFFNYCADTIDSMNGLHFSVSNKKLIFMNKNLRNYLEKNYSEKIKIIKYKKLKTNIDFNNNIIINKNEEKCNNDLAAFFPFEKNSTKNNFGKFNIFLEIFFQDNFFLN